MAEKGKRTRISEVTLGFAKKEEEIKEETTDEQRKFQT